MAFWDLDCGVLPPLVKLKPQGQAFWDQAGTFTWVCPEGVDTVSLAMVGGGGAPKLSGSRMDNGNGGNLRWVNEVAVVPGQSYTLVIGNGNMAVLSAPSSALGYRTDTAVGTVLKGVNGGVGPTGYNRYGGNAGLLETGLGNGGYGIDLKTMLSVQTAPAGVDRNTTRTGLAAGGGGAAWQSADGNTRRSFPGAPGAVRIIWGEGRAFPDQGIADVTPRS